MQLATKELLGKRQLQGLYVPTVEIENEKEKGTEKARENKKEKSTR